MNLSNDPDRLLAVFESDARAHRRRARDRRHVRLARRSSIAPQRP